MCRIKGFEVPFKSEVNHFCQVLQLYNIYRVDHELFGFSPRKFLDVAS